MKMIVGLGNPGPEYSFTRHNIGFQIVDALAEQDTDIQWTPSNKANALIGTYHHKKEKILLVKPQTYMNLSGGAISILMKYYKLQPDEDLLICYDDKDIPFGTLRMRSKGSSGGHNGIKSIISALGTQEFQRLKIGIGHENQRLSTHDFVLQRFSKEEEEQIPELIGDSLKKISNWLK